MKSCRICGEAKPLTEYHKQSSARDGHQSRCKECAKALARRWYAENKERALAAARAYRERRGEEWARGYQRAYYEAHKDKWREENWTAEQIERRRQSEWMRMQTPEARTRKRAADCDYYVRNADRFKAAAARRRARLLGVSVSEFTDRDWRRIVSRQRGCCFYCESDADLTKDHLLPLIRGGSHTVGNIVGACVRCNCQKGSRTVMEYRVWLAKRQAA